MSPDADANNRDAAYHYEAFPGRNWAGYAVELAQAKYEEANPNDPKYGIRWGVRKVLKPTSEPPQ
jgi:hypothetical protein